MLVELLITVWYNGYIKIKKGMIIMRVVSAFEKNLYVGWGSECNRLIRKMEKSGVARMLKCQRDQMTDCKIYGVFVDRSGRYAPEPTIIILGANSVAQIVADYYGKEV